MSNTKPYYPKLSGRMAELGITPKQLAELIGVDYSYFTQKINGKTKKPFDINQCQMMAEYLKSTVDTLFVRQ